MIQDRALELKKIVDAGKNVGSHKAKNMLTQSQLIKKLLSAPKQRPGTFVGLRAVEWRLLELSEIPFTYTLPKVQEWIRLLVDRTQISEGFSLTGDRGGMMACHNAMITKILIKMEYDDKEKIKDGINWILNYQNVERGKESKWTGKDLTTK
jgi:hypothetical protein